MRIFIIVASVLFGLMLLAAAIGFGLWSYKGADAIAAVEQGTSDGVRAGNAGDDTDCRDQSMSLIAECDGFICGLYDQAFTSTCLLHASRGDLCDEFPKDLGFSGGVLWVSKQCQAMGQQDSECGGVMQTMLDHCSQEF